MKNKLMRLKLNRQINKLKKKMKKQEKQMITILDKLEQLEPKGKEIIINK
ncbi:MAG: hypothetical protein ACI31M_00660 [Bacilli bacterium]